MIDMKLRDMLRPLRKIVKQYFNVSSIVRYIGFVCVYVGLVINITEMGHTDDNHVKINGKKKFNNFFIMKNRIKEPFSHHINIMSIRTYLKFRQKDQLKMSQSQPSLIQIVKKIFVKYC